MRDILSEIWATTKRNKLRTFLTGFAVAWGIFMIIFLLGAGNGLINAQVENNDRYFANSMTIYPGYTSKAYMGMQPWRQIRLGSHDFNFTNTEYPDIIDELGTYINRGELISYEQEFFNGMLSGVYPNHSKIKKLDILYGRFINQIDVHEKRKVVVLGRKKAKELTSDIGSLVGKNVKAGNIAFKVIGIYKGDDNSSDDEAYIPHSTLVTMYGWGDDVGNLEFSFHGLPTKKDNEDFEKAYRGRINTYHSAAPSDENALWISNHFVSNMEMTQAIGILHKALWIIGMLTLLSGIVGVSNIMLITVRERTHEFGIRKAIGARPWSILRLIITESVILTTFFGYLGMVLGVVADEVMDATLGHMTFDSGLFSAKMFYNSTVGLDVCVEATLVMIIAGTIAGLIPAYKAAKIRPIEALRAD